MGMEGVVEVGGCGVWVDECRLEVARKVVSHCDCVIGSGRI